MFTIGSLFPRNFPAGGEGTHHAHLWLPRHRLSDRLAFGANVDSCGRNGDNSSCNTRYNAIAVSADSRRGSTEPRGLTDMLTFASRCEGTQRVAPCNTRGWILARSSNNPENGALGSLERTADLRMPTTENYRNLYPALIRHRQSMPWYWSWRRNVL